MKLFGVCAKAAFYVFRPALRAWYKGHESRRVRVVVRCDDKLLLVKTSFSNHRFYLPGGGIEKGEEPSAAAVRELREETGLKLHAKQLQLVGVLQTTQTNIPFHITVFECQVDSTQLPPLTFWRTFEILERQWFALSDLQWHDPVIAWYVNRDNMC